MKARSSKRTLTRLLATLAAFFFAAQLNSAHAVTITPGSILPNAISFEYFGLNLAVNVQTSDTLGTLNYGGQPGCGGNCSATTTLGASPSVSTTVNEVVFGGASGGVVEGRLGYYVAYLNTPGTYGVNLHATDILSAPDGRPMSAYLAFGPAGTNFANFNNFTSKTFQEADCANTCPSGFGFPTGPFAPDNLVQMDANTLYFIELDLMTLPDATNIEISGLIDPTFSASGGRFLFSPGVFSVVQTPLPAALPLLATGIGGLGLLGWGRRRTTPRRPSPSTA